MCGPACPRLIRRKVPAAPEEEAAAVAVPEAAEEAAADGPTPVEADDSNVFDYGSEVLVGICNVGQTAVGVYNTGY